MKNLFLLTLITLTALTACKKKSDDAETKSESKTEKLCKKPWQLTGWKYSKDGGAYQDLYLPKPGSFKDNKYYFAADSSLTIDESSLKPTPSSPQTMSSYWYFTEGEAKIFIKYFNKVPAEIKTLDDNNMLLLEHYDQGGANDFYEYTFKR